MEYLKDDFNCTGIDFHQEMINIARRKLGNKVKLMQGDMANFNLHKQYLCNYNEEDIDEDFAMSYGNYKTTGGLCSDKFIYFYEMEMEVRC